MSDQDGFDPCECLSFHEIAMRRLLNMLRQSQSHCTDSECIDDITASPLRSENDEGIFMLSVLIIMALLMYYLRPNVFRNRVTSVEKPCFNQHDSNGTPPTPPPSSG